MSDSCNYLYSINGSALYMVMVVHIDHWGVLETNLHSLDGSYNMTHSH